MYRLYVVMKERPPNEITADEIALASGKKILDPGALSEFLQKLESSSMTIQRAFEKQVKVAAVSLLYLQFNMKLMFQRVLGIRIASKNCWQSGSLQRINHSLQLKNQNFESCSCIRITPCRTSRYPIAIQSKIGS
jgi:hypothetical protein